MAYKFWTNRYTASWIRNIRALPQRVQRYFINLYVKRLVKTGRVLERTGSHNGVLTMLEKDAVKDLVYGGLTEIINNKKYYYQSSVGKNYCYFTEAGKVAVSEFISGMSYMIISAEEQSLNRRAKDLVIKGLKGEKV